MNKTVKKALIAGAGILAANDLIRLNRFSRNFATSVKGFKITKSGRDLIVKFNLIIVSNEPVTVKVSGVRGYFNINGQMVGLFRGLDTVNVNPGSNSIPIEAKFAQSDTIQALLSSIGTGAGSVDMIYQFKATYNFLHLLPVGIWIRGNERVNLQSYAAIIKSWFNATK